MSPPGAKEAGAGPAGVAAAPWGASGAAAGAAAAAARSTGQGEASAAGPAFKILLVEDDESIAGLVAEGLRAWGYEVAVCGGREEPAAVFARELPALVVLDVNLPRYDGFQWCRELRRSSTAPVLFLSARSEGMDQVMGLASGGDDYLAKPFSMEVLLARVRALLRRAYAYAEAEPELLARGGALLDLGRARIEGPGGKAELTRAEFRILSVLMRRAGSVVPKAEVAEALWSDEVFVDDNSLNVAVARLRKTLAGIGLEGLVLTRKGEGYLVP